MHLGTAIIRGSHPLNAASLIERHPRTRFLLMHLAYPWSHDLLGMAFVYRNIWLDLTWSLLLSPSHFKLALHEAIEMLPDESRMMIGGEPDIVAPFLQDHLEYFSDCWLIINDQNLRLECVACFLLNCRICL